jgi:uncharacterized protein (TIGR04255 family)
MLIISQQGVGIFSLAPVRSLMFTRDEIRLDRMNDISFEKAPVIELIAELRWNPPGTTNTGGGLLSFTLGGGGEEFFQHFGNQVAKHGFTKAERVTPAGFPVLWHQVVWRFRNPDDASALIQVGLGLFSANALQPYKRWSVFRPTVELGLRALLATRPTQELHQPLSGVSLRYINAFTGDLLKEHLPSSFIRDVLGFKLTLPDNFARITDPDRPLSTSMNISIPIRNTSKTMSISIGDGQINAEPAALFNIAVAETDEIPSTPTQIMAALDASRNIIHEKFIELTIPLTNVMKPIEAGSAS